MTNYNKPSVGFHTNPERINKAGRNKLQPIYKQIRELERTELTEGFSEMLRMVRPELREIIEDPKTCVRDLGIAKSILKWLETGDFRFIQPYIEYIFGKPKETIDHNLEIVRIRWLTPEEALEKQKQIQ